MTYKQHQQVKKQIQVPNLYSKKDIMHPGTRRVKTSPFERSKLLPSSRRDKSDTEENGAG